MTMIASGLVALMVGMVGLGVGEADRSIGPVAPTAGAQEAGVLTFRVLDDSGQAVPSRLTFLPDSGGRPNLFPNADADPDVLAVRRNVVYSIRGEGSITVPAGRYTVLASRGLEYGLDRTRLDLRPGEQASWTARITREVDTTGWISADFHLHTLTHSGHGDSNMPERIISMVGEGVEFAVATDHNHNTDYGPTIDRVGAGDRVTAVTGNEISTGIGHFNAFPLDPDARVVPYTLPSAEPLFKMVREQENEFGVVPVIQVNHPRWSGINYFGEGGLDPITAGTDSDIYSDDFDTIEIFNENEGFGYFDPDVAEVDTASENFSVLRDWFNLLNRGHRYAAVGNSDSHHVEAEMAGYPRNFLPSPTDDPAAIEPADVAAALRANRVFTTIGPFVEFTVDGEPMGGQVRVARGRSSVEIGVRVQAASWVDCDVVKIVLNGDVVDTIDVPQTREIVRLDATRRVPVSGDCWIALLVEGDEPLAPVVHDQARPIYPLAVLNPVWVDADGDGMWVAPLEQASHRVRRARDARALVAELEQKGTLPHERALAVQAAASASEEAARALVSSLLDDENRYVRLSAAKAAARLKDRGLLPALGRASRHADGDAHLRVALFKARTACGAPDAADELLDMLASEGAGGLGRFAEELGPILGDNFVGEWRVAGFFPSPEAGTVLATPYPPEQRPRADSFPNGKTGTVEWRTLATDRRGFANLLTLESRPEVRNDAIAYLQCWLVSPDDREVVFTLGTDDGCRLWINDEVIHEDGSRHGADPLQHVGRVRLREGRNRVLLKVENGGGDFGAYFRVLDDEIRSTIEPR